MKEVEENLTGCKGDLREILLKAVCDVKTQKTEIKHNLFKIVTSLESSKEVKLLSARLSASPYCFTLNYKLEGNVISIFHALVDCCQTLDSSVFCRLVNLNYRGEVNYLILVGHKGTDGSDVVDCNVLIKQVGFYTLGADTNSFKQSVKDGFLSTVSEVVVDSITLALMYEKPVTYLYEDNKPVYYGFNDLGEIEVQINIDEVNQ